MKERRTGGITGRRREALVVRVMKVLDQHNFTPFEFEGFCRHQLRSRFCLEGMSWAKADYNAADIVGAALRRLGAKRPSWEEGQPRWTERGYIFVERTRCVQCGWKLPENHKLFCSGRCASAAYRERHGEHVTAMALAWRLQRRTTHTCEHCERPFERYQERHKGPARYCSRACYHRARRIELEEALQERLRSETGSA